MENEKMTRQIEVKKLTPEAFNPYGSYLDVVRPTGYEMKGTYHTFYRDVVRFVPGNQDPVCFSSLIVRKNPEFICTGMEYHDHTEEIQLPIDADGVLFCAPANDGALIPEEVEAFRIPAGTLLCLRRGTWHDVMYPHSADAFSVLIGLPERIYHNDLVWKDFEGTKLQAVITE
ncbi:MAG: hypothetical protein HUJ73_03375 [Eubacterium sp.]|nr:hypothetical protein [Eubacterium sp.]